jgi:hypothetical protein
MFSFVGLCRPYILCTLHDNYTTENTLDINRAFFSVALVCHAVTCAFDASRFEMAIIFGVPISLTVCAYGNIPFLFGRFELHFALLYTFYIEYVLAIWGRFQFYKNMESDS